MALLVRRAVRPLQRGANQWLQQAGNQGQAQGPAVAVAVAGGGIKSWTAAGMARFLAANPAASTSASSDPGLLRILRSEIEHERGDYKQPAKLAKGPPKPWTLVDTPGKQEIILRRSYGQEDIAVTAVYQPSEEPSDDNDDEEDGDDDDAVAPQNVSHLTVTVSKGADEPALEFSCTVYDGASIIDHIAYVEDKDSKETSSYDGPPYHELDEELRNKFDDYLSARGIDDAFTKYLKDLLPDKERREYKRWLGNVENFVRK